MQAIRVELQLADGTFKTGMLRAGQSLAQFQKELVKTSPQLERLANTGKPLIRTMDEAGKSTKSFLGTMRDVSIVVGATTMAFSLLGRAANGWVGDIVRVNAEMERLNYQMRAMSGASDPIKEAADNVEYLRNAAMRMPFSLKTITSGFVKLQATGTNPLNGSLQALADGIAAFGGTDESFQRTILGISQASGKGVLQMEELRQQIGEAMPNAMQLLARSMGMTVGQLAKEIQSGTVAARPALQKLYEELDRVYGGTAQRMMQTFSGQMTKLNTGLQKLATNKGMTGFFDQVKGQLVDINEFLAGDMAQRIATSMGQGLASLVQDFRDVISVVWEFRDEIGRAAKMAAITAAFATAARAATAFANTLEITRQKWVYFSTAVVSRSADISRAMKIIEGGHATMFAFGAIAKNVTGIIGTAIAGFATFAPIIVGLGSAILMAADYFGVFRDKTKDAWEELKKFGAESSKVAKQVTDDRANQLRALIAEQEEKKARSFAAKPTYAYGHLYDAKITEYQKELEEVLRVGAEATAKAQEQEAERELQRFEAQLSEKQALLQNDYKIEQAGRDKQYDESLAKAKENGQSELEITQNYHKELTAARVGLSNELLKLYDAYQADLEKRMADAANSDDNVEYERAKKQLARISELQTQERERKRQAEKDAYGVTRTSAGGAAAQEKAVKNGETALNRLNADIAGLQASLDGASGAAAEMAQKIASGDYGSVSEGGEEVQKLHDKLIEAANAKEQLDKLMKGKQKAQNDFDAIKQQYKEDRLALEMRKTGRDFNAADKFKFKLDNGGYYGLGSYDNIKKAVSGIVTEMNRQGIVADRVAKGMRENAYSDATNSKIDETKNHINMVTEAIKNLGNALSGLNFGSFGNSIMSGLSGGMFGSGSGPMTLRNAGPLLELIAKGESGGNYNATLDNGLWTNGPQNLVGMTLNEVRALQNQMLSNPANRAKYGNGKGSSALGKYQIVGSTLQSLMNSMGLTGNELFDEDMQDMLATALAKGRLSKNDPIAELRKEWTSLNNVDAGTISNAVQMGNAGPTVQNAAALKQNVTLPTFQPVLNETMESQIQQTNILSDGATQLSENINTLQQETEDLDLSDWTKSIKDATSNLDKGVVDTANKYKQTLEKIQAGGFGISKEEKNVEADRYKEVLELAKQYDVEATKILEKRKLEKTATKEQLKIEQDRKQINERIAEEQKKLADPNYRPDSSAIRQITEEMDKYLANMQKLYGADSDQYKQALDVKTNYLRQQKLLESTIEQQGLNKEMIANRNAIMNQTQLRQQAMQKELAEVDAALQRRIAAGASEVQAVADAEAQKAAIRAKYAQQASPFTQQMQQWADLEGNLQKGAAQWMDTLAGGLTDLITGTGDLKSTIQSILKSMVNMGLKYLMGSMFQGKNGSSGKSAKGQIASGGGKKGATGGGSKLMGLFGLAHTGGVIGSSALRTKRATPLNFIGAPKFHTGGIVDALAPGEVPIIAKKGEGVFTPEQMRAMGGYSQSQQINISSPITVNGSAGTPEQNNDLAKKMAKEYESSMRGMIAEEMRRQTRPGNYFGNTRR